MSCCRAELWDADHRRAKEVPDKDSGTCSGTISAPSVRGIRPGKLGPSLEERVKSGKFRTVAGLLRRWRAGRETPTDTEGSRRFTAESAGELVRCLAGGQKRTSAVAVGKTYLEPFLSRGHRMAGSPTLAAVRQEVWDSLSKPGVLVWAIGSK
jgi:hypothetical protein